MRFNSHVALGLLAGTLTTAIPTPQDEPAPPVPTAPSSDVNEASQQLAQLLEFAQSTVNATLESSSKAKRGTCSLGNVSVRREWNSLSNNERKAYTDAVLCLQAKQSRTPSSLVPGAKSRFDDWVATHINQTLTIHYTGTFLAWHRYFTWQYEQALRNECGYRGSQPYWDWARTAITGLEASPMLDGSAYSMSGNGEPIPNKPDIVIGGSPGLPEVILPAGSGGGCVTSGPFANMKVNLGPVSMQLPGNITVGGGPGTGLDYNPRCLKRDLTNYANQRWANATSVVRTILNPKDIDSFQMTLQGIPGSGDLAVHGGGHYSMGGDPGRDLFVSPGDPLFYLHHASIDRTWWIWQTLDFEKRTGAQGIAGTQTFLNMPPSAAVTLDTPIDLGYAAGPTARLGDLLSTVDGPFCYIYL